MLQISQTVNFNLAEWRETYEQLLVYCNKLEGEMNKNKQAIINLSSQNAELLVQIKKFEDAQKFEENTKCELCEELRFCAKQGISLKEYQQKKMIEKAVAASCIKKPNKESTSVDHLKINESPIQVKDPLTIVITAKQPNSKDQEGIGDNAFMDDIDILDDGEYIPDNHIDDDLMNSDVSNDDDDSVPDVDFITDINKVKADFIKDEMDDYFDVDESNGSVDDLTELDVKLEAVHDAKKKQKKEIMEEILAAGNHDSMQDITDKNTKDQTVENTVSTDQRENLQCGGKGSSVCSLCDSTFTKKASLSEHIQAVHYLIKKYNCSVCKFSTSYMRSLRIHQRKHDQVKVQKFKCKRCDEIFSNNDDLMSHKNTHKSAKKVFKCKQCDKQYPHSLTLKKHVATIHSEISYKCPLCKFVTKYKITHAQHIEKQHYRKLKISQPIPKKKKCKKCPEEFISLEDLKIHKTLKHRKLYNCKVCPKVYKESGSLLDHVMSHHNENGEEFICPECTYTTKNRTFMGAHIRRQHRKKSETKNLNLYRN